MLEIQRLIPELHPATLRKNAIRFWKIYIHPPEERRVFVRPEKTKKIGERLAEVPTLREPKQVVFDYDTNFAYVSCMKGKCLQVFQIEGNRIKLHKNIRFEDQCVEVATKNGLVFATTTNFERPPRITRNKLYIFDAKSQEKVSEVDTGGNWSKLIAIRPQGDEVLVSNWHSHDISIIDITNVKKPKVKQILKWGEAPRGIDFLPLGNKAIVTGFYSGNLGFLSRSEDSKWKVEYTSPPFDTPNYSGNMRHVIALNSQEAVVSNLGRNLVHFWSIEKKTFYKSISVGKSPNSMCLVDGILLAVSCRDSSAVYFIDFESKRLIGRSPTTGKEPTGLCGVKSGFLLTCFKSNTLSMFSTKPF